MEILAYYLIAAVSLAITVTINYGLDIVKTIEQSLIVLDIEINDYPWSAKVYLSVFFLCCLLAFPFTLFFIVKYDKWHIVKIFSKQVLYITFKAGK